MPKNDFDKWEIEEAAKRAVTYDRDKIKKKSDVEQAKHDVGIGIEDGTEEVEEDEEE